MDSVPQTQTRVEKKKKPGGPGTTNEPCRDRKKKNWHACFASWRRESVISRLHHGSHAKNSSLPPALPSKTTHGTTPSGAHRGIRIPAPVNFGATHDVDQSRQAIGCTTLVHEVLGFSGFPQHIMCFEVLGLPHRWSMSGTVGRILFDDVARN